MTVSKPQNRYIRQMALPQIGLDGQARIEAARVLVVGAGGLGAASLPYLAGAGIGSVALIDPDAITIHNLHRQTIYKTAQEGLGKAQVAAQYLKELNPDIKVMAHAMALNADNAAKLCEGYDLIIDGTDRFEAKSILNEAAIAAGAPYITASVVGMKGYAGIFAGHKAGFPCLRCLFPEWPHMAADCNSAGVLGTAAGMLGLLTAHLAIAYLAGMSLATPGHFWDVDLETMRWRPFVVQKDPQCPSCSGYAGLSKPAAKSNTEASIPLLRPAQLQNDDYILIDVRTMAEIEAKPLAGALHIELSSLPVRYRELPQEKLLAFACAANVRSRQAAEFMRSKGYTKLCVYDVLAR